MKRPQWFEEWRENEFKHLTNDVNWIKWAMILLIIAAIANIFV